MLNCIFCLLPACLYCLVRKLFVILCFCRFSCNWLKNYMCCKATYCLMHLLCVEIQIFFFYKHQMVLIVLQQQQVTSLAAGHINFLHITHMYTVSFFQFMDWDHTKPHQTGLRQTASRQDTRAHQTPHLNFQSDVNVKKTPEPVHARA